MFSINLQALFPQLLSGENKKKIIWIYFYSVSSPTEWMLLFTRTAAKEPQCGRKTAAQWTKGPLWQTRESAQSWPKESKAPPPYDGQWSDFTVWSLLMKVKQRASAWHKKGAAVINSNNYAIINWRLALECLCLQAVNEIKELENTASFLVDQTKTLIRLRTKYLKDLTQLTGVYNSFTVSGFFEMLNC